MLHIQIILQYFYKLLVRTKNLMAQAHLEHQCLVLQTKPKQQKIITQRVGRQIQYSSGLSLGLRSRSPSKGKQITELLRIKLSLVSLEVEFLVSFLFFSFFPLKTPFFHWEAFSPLYTLLWILALYLYASGLFSEYLSHQGSAEYGKRDCQL